MDCKRAFDEAKGDLVAAKEIIRAQGLTKAEKKGDRKTGAGILEAHIHNGRIGVLLEVRCETDFVARGDLMKSLAHDIAMHISAMDPATTDDLLAQPYVRDESVTVADVVKGVIAQTGENILIERFARFEV
jgi:elongation factor Ts